MRLLHTSDWHLGKKLYEIDFEQHHRLFLDWLLETIENERIDVLLIAGDIFDQAHPPKAAERLYYDFLKKMYRSRCKQVIVTGGNHDSTGTLEAPKDVLEVINVSTIGAVNGDIQDQIIEISDENGELEAVVAAVPFLRDKDIRKALAGESYDEKVLQIKEGIIRHYAQLGDYCAAEYSLEIPLIATGHLFVHGVSSDAESVREIQLGNLAGVEASMFHSRFDYVALGHIHKPQNVNAPMPVRYSGAPIALSFSERNYEHSVTLIDTLKKPLNPEAILVPHFRELVSLNGTYEEIQIKLSVLNGDPKMPTLVELQFEEENHDLAILPKVDALVEEVNKLTATKGVHIARKRIHFSKATTGADELFDQVVDIDSLTVGDIFEMRMEEEEIPDQTQEQLRMAFKEIQESLYQEAADEDTRA
ncbi:MAG: exonuclease subunit SbcD [Bacteroidales bacterium]|nr:exonuclease subunit SbcD [Bacteroidales bacterium]